MHAVVLVRFAASCHGLLCIRVKRSLGGEDLSLWVCTQINVSFVGKVYIMLSGGS